MSVSRHHLMSANPSGANGRSVSFMPTIRSAPPTIASTRIWTDAGTRPRNAEISDASHDVAGLHENDRANRPGSTWIGGVQPADGSGFERRVASKDDCTEQPDCCAGTVKRA